MCGGERHVMQETMERVSVALADHQAGGGKATTMTQTEWTIVRLSHGGKLQERCRSCVESRGCVVRTMQRATGTESQGQFCS
jgi:hypothetical protein